MRKSLFDPEYNSWTQDANDLDSEFQKLIADFIIEKTKAYNHRDLENVLFNTIQNVVIEAGARANLEITLQKKRDCLSANKASVPSEGKPE